MPLFSIVVPCQNVADRLPAALAHVQAQPYGNWEVICVNDGSDDRTLSVALAAAQADPRVRVVHQAREGGDRACRAGLVAALGEWVVFVTPDMLLDLVDLYDLQACAVATPDAGALRLIGTGLLGGCYRRDLMLTADGFQIASDRSLAQDFETQLVAAQATQIDVIATVAAKNRIARSRPAVSPLRLALAA